MSHTPPAPRCRKCGHPMSLQPADPDVGFRQGFWFCDSEGCEDEYEPHNPWPDCEPPEESICGDACNGGDPQDEITDMEGMPYDDCCHHEPVLDDTNDSPSDPS